MLPRGSAHETNTYERIKIFVAKMIASLGFVKSICFLSNDLYGPINSSPFVPLIRTGPICTSRGSAARVTRLKGMNSALLLLHDREIN